MNKKIFISVTLILLFTSVCLAQNARLQSAGGLSFILQDRDNSLNLYDFGHNISWLIIDEQQDMLRIDPGFSRTWGDYKRKYDFGSSNIYNLSFLGIKSLGESGTFLGGTSYSYDKRCDVPRTLRHSPYTGDSFFPEDSSTGNYRYNGPKMGFGYSYELITDLYIGASANYQVLEGLKDVYSNTQTTIRNIGGQAAVSYRISESLTAGATYDFFDCQEAIEMTSLTGTNVEVLNYRGETYAVATRGSSIPQKIRLKGGTAGLQFHLIPDERVEVALAGNYGVSGEKYLLKLSTLTDSEEGYASFENFDCRLASTYKAAEDLLLGVRLSSENSNSWSKNSAIDLMLWKWKVNSFSAAAGAQYFIEPAALLMGIELEQRFVNADSSKFIDSRFAKINSSDSFIRIGAEKEIMHDFFLRAGFSAGKIGTDLVSGGTGLKVNSITAGIGMKISDLVFVDISLQYGSFIPDSGSSIYRDKFNALASVRVLSF